MDRSHLIINTLKKYLLFFIMIFILANFMSSCKSTKALSSKKVNKEYKSSKLFNKLKKSNIDYKWYSFKANADVFFGGNTIGGFMDIRMKKDEFIWMSVKKFGMEFARIMIKPDSFFVIDRFNNQYMAMPIDSFKKEYEVPFDFMDFQEILAGNNLVEDQTPVEGRKINDEYTLRTKNDDLKIDYTFDSAFKIKRSEFSDQKNHTVVSDFSNYKPYNKREISYLRKYSYPDDKNPKYFIKLKIKKLEIDIPKKVKFEIPANYDKI